jgi:[ribosomal protein S5]-alanine N-acetyltransferase
MQIQARDPLVPSMTEISLAPVRREDRPALIDAHLESRAHHHPWTSPFIDSAGFDAWFARLDPDRMVSLIARHAPTDGIVGLCTLSEIVRGGFQSAYLGFHGMIAFAKRGFMTEAVRMTVRHAFERLELHRVEANIQPDNTASIALVRRVGFRKEGYSPDYLKIGGLWKDHERWAILSSGPIS